MGKNTRNNLKQKVKNMTTKEKEKLLKDLQADLMFYKTKALQAPLTVRDKNVWLLRRQIAYLKSELKFKGFHYNPRSM